MWKTEELGVAHWQSGETSWKIDARGGDYGISFPGSPFPAFSFLPVDGNDLPGAAEQYVRGDDWHINYPQEDGSFAIRLAMRVVESHSELLVLESTVSLQTELLDLHPKLDIEVMCNDIDSFVPTNEFGDEEVTGKGSAPISLAKNASQHTSVLLGPHDSPFTTNVSTDSMLKLRLFGDFLEKGVIRKARPWFVIDRRGTVTPEAELEAWWKQLCDEPLPLAP